MGKIFHTIYTKEESNEMNFLYLKEINGSFTPKKYYNLNFKLKNYVLGQILNT